MERNQDFSETYFEPIFIQSEFFYGSSSNTLIPKDAMLSEKA
jgi:hypothetical protein